MLSYCSVVMTGSAELPCLLLTETSSLYLSVWQCQTFRNFYRLAGFSLYNIPPVNFGFLITFCLFQADIGIRRCIIHIIHHKMAGSLICKADVKCCPGKCGEIFCSVYLRIVCISKIFPFYLLPVICIILVLIVTVFAGVRSI